MGNQTLNIYTLSITFLFIFSSFTLTAQDCFFTTSYDIVEVANNGDGTCDYVVDMCAIVDENSVVHAIEYSVLFDSDGDGDDESILSYTFNMGIQIPSGSYCLSASAPAQTFNITTPCGDSIMLILTGLNNNTNEDCINLMEDGFVLADDELVIEEIELMDNTDELNVANETEVVIPTTQIVSNQTTNSYEVYPTSTNQMIHLNLEEALEENLTLTIADINGNVLINDLLEPGDIQKTIMVDELQAGMYFLLARNGKTTLAPKPFIKIN